MSEEQAVDKSVGSADMAVDEAARLAAQKQRSVWLALALFGFVILIGLTSALQLKNNLEQRAGANDVPRTESGSALKPEIDQ